ncbi:hypothetical protein LOS10_11945, partial [Proteus mirabilis]|uniref:hypothetical protein n=1 Tax=Proteus mirabilis TaxID=584 RepID=UPI001E5D77D9
MKIIHIIDSFRIGGVEIGILSLLNSNKDYKVITVNGCDIELYNSLSKVAVKSSSLVAKNSSISLSEIG